MESFIENDFAKTIMSTKQKKKSLPMPNPNAQTKSRQNYGVYSQAILRSLRQYGAMSRAEIEVQIGIPKYSISAIISRLHKDAPRIGKQIYISGYVYDADGQRRYPRALYNIGCLPDAKKPKPNKLEIKRKYIAKKDALMRMNSVFNLGKSRTQLRKEHHDRAGH